MGGERDGLKESEEHGRGAKREREGGRQEVEEMKQRR